MTFDPRTLAVMIVALTFISAGMLALVQGQARNVRGVAWWSWSELLLALGLMFNLQQASLSPWISMVLGSVLVIGGFLLNLCGIRVYNNEAPYVKGSLAVIALVAVASAWLAVIDPQPQVRIALMSFIIAGIGTCAARALLIRVAQPLRTAYWITGSAYALYALVMLARAFFVGVMGHNTQGFTPSPLNIATFATGAIAQLTITFGLILMVTYRMSMNMERLASLDALTGALNRRSFEQRATSLAANGAGRSIGVIMLDIDHFKQVNDRYGHPAGDFVLQKVTTLARAQLRERDLFARMGGEEFCVVLAEGDEDRAVRIAERIREVCSREPMHFNDIDISVRLSAGVAAGRVTGGALEELIGEADLALYEAKQTGRNKVVRWSAIADFTRPVPAQRIALPDSFPQMS